MFAMNINIKFIAGLFVLILMFSGCVRYHHYVQTSIGDDKAILSYNVGYHLVAGSSEDENVFIEKLLQEDLKSLQLCSKGYVIDRKSRSRHSDYHWNFHCQGSK